MEFQDFDKVIEKFKEPYKLNKYNKRNIIILEKFIKIINEQKKNLTDIMKEENKEWHYNYSIDKFFEIIKEYEGIKNIKNKKFGIGNIVAIEIENPYLFLDLIIKTILSNCRIMIISGPAMISFNMYVLSIIQEVLRKDGLDQDLISMVNILDYKKRIIDNEDAIDCIIVNRDYDEYYYFIEKTTIKVVYLDYGNLNLYIDEDENEDIIRNIIVVANENDMDLYRYNIKNLESFLKEESNNYIFNTAIIYSKDIKKCMKLCEVIKAKNIFINTFDINKIEIGLDINELLFEKKIIIEDGK